jgi:hypothetical protein
MKAKTVLTVALLVFVGASVAYLAAKEVRRRGAAAASAADAGPADVVVVTYFYTNVRCPTCRKIEAYTQEAVEQGFADDIAAGRVVWRALNTDEAAHAHFVDDYGLLAKSVVVSRRQGGKEADWKNLDRIWDLVGDKDAFVSYVRDEVAASLKGP